MARRVVEEDDLEVRPWSGTHDDVRALAGAMEEQLAPLRDRALAQVQEDYAWASEDTRAQRVDAERQRWRVQATLNWYDGRRKLEEDGTVDDVLAVAETLDVPPTELSLIVLTSTGRRAAAVTVLKRDLGAYVLVRNLDEPYAGRLASVLRDQLHRRRPGRGEWVLTGRAEALLYVTWMITYIPIVVVTPDQPLWIPLSQAAVLIAVFFGLLRWFARWRGTLPRFELRRPREPTTLGELHRQGVRFAVVTVGVAAVVNLATGALAAAL